MEAGNTNYTKINADYIENCSESNKRKRENSESDSKSIKKSGSKDSGLDRSSSSEDSEDYEQRRQNKYQKYLQIREKPNSVIGLSDSQAVLRENPAKLKNNLDTSKFRNDNAQNSNYQTNEQSLNSQVEHLHEKSKHDLENSQSNFETNENLLNGSFDSFDYELDSFNSTNGYQSNNHDHFEIYKNLLESKRAENPTNESSTQFASKQGTQVVNNELRKSTGSIEVVGMVSDTTTINLDDLFNFNPHENLIDFVTGSKRSPTMPSTEQIIKPQNVSKNLESNLHSLTSAKCQTTQTSNSQSSISLANSLHATSNYSLTQIQSSNPNAHQDSSNYNPAIISSNLNPVKNVSSSRHTATLTNYSFVKTLLIPNHVQTMPNSSSVATSTNLSPALISPTKLPSAKFNICYGRDKLKEANKKVDQNALSMPSLDPDPVVESNSISTSNSNNSNAPIFNNFNSLNSTKQTSTLTTKNLRKNSTPVKSFLIVDLISDSEPDDPDDCVDITPEWPKVDLTLSDNEDEKKSKNKINEKGCQGLKEKEEDEFLRNFLISDDSCDNDKESKSKNDGKSCHNNLKAAKITSEVLTISDDSSSSYETSCSDENCLLHSNCGGKKKA